MEKRFWECKNLSYVGRGFEKLIYFHILFFFFQFEVFKKKVSWELGEGEDLDLLIGYSGRCRERL